MLTGEDIRLLRTIKNIPQKTVAKKLRNTQQAVSKNEHSRNISERNFEKYLKTTNCSREEFEKLKKILSPPLINKITVLKRMLHQ